MNVHDTICRHLSTLEEIRLKLEPVEIFPDTFKEVLNELDMTDQQIAHASKWSPAMICYVKSGTRLPSVDKLRRLVDGLHLEPYMMRVFELALETHRKLIYICEYITSVENGLREMSSDDNNLSSGEITTRFTKHRHEIDNLLNDYKQSASRPIAPTQHLYQPSERKIVLTAGTLLELLAGKPEDFPLEILETPGNRVVSSDPDRVRGDVLCSL